MKKAFIFNLITIATLICSQSSKAGTTNTVYWNFNTAAPTSGVFSGLTVSSLSQGNNHGTTTLISTTSASSGYTTAAGFTASGTGNAGAAVFTNAPFSTATSTYFQFDVSLSAAAGAAYQVSQIYDISLGARATSTGPQLLSLYSSTDDFTSDFTSIASLSIPNNSAWVARDFSNIAISLPEDGSTVSFRIYASNGVGNATSGTANLRIDDLSFTVSSVPEPSTIALATMGGLACLMAVRRKR
ncbi:MAG TPA: PEP-CTERM sorting domain-containing protein [Verrucomicrobiae bacterium]|jgi:hypothetical protein